MIDGYGRKITYLRLSVTDLCDLRCRYCMPEGGIQKKPQEDMLTEEEMIQAVSAAAALGITKVRITGGEPLVKKNILSICRGVTGIPGIQETDLTTNGRHLGELAQPLREAGIRRVNISLDTLDEEKYRKMTRVGTLGQAWDGVLAALGAGFEKIKINVVLIGGFNDDEVVSLAELTRQYPVDVRFIEWMPMDVEDHFGREAMIPCQTVLAQLPEAEPVRPDGGVAKLFRLPGALGNIGLVTPVSSQFCSACNRLRLSADGYIKPCLHSPEEISLKGLDYEGMKQQFEKAIMAKPFCREPLSVQTRSRAGRTMNRIGG